LFPFGHGLSYTQFKYTAATTDKKKLAQDETVTVSTTVQNTGKREGSEIIQLYITDQKSSLPRPVKELKGFEKISLKPGEVKTVSFTLDKSALSYFDDKKHEWVAEPGTFKALIGSSSRDIRAEVSFELTE